MTIDPDHMLMQRVAGGDKAAYRQLVEKHASPCLRFAERMLGNRADAEDVTQEVCLKLWNEAPRWQAKAKLSTWLYRVTFNACIDKRRKIIPLAGVEMETLMDTSPGSDQAVADRQQAERVRQALQQLPERQRAAVLLSYYDEVSNDQAAEALGIERGAFQQLLFRARQNLKESLYEFWREQKNG